MVRSNYSLKISYKFHTFEVLVLVEYYNWYNAIKIEKPCSSLKSLFWIKFDIHEKDEIFLIYRGINVL